VRRAALALFAVVLVAIVAACGGGGGSSSSSPPPALLKPGKLNAKSPQLYSVKFHTTKGDFVVDVHRTWAPLAAQRFYNLVKNGFYDNAKFFRVVPNFVVQFGISPYPTVSKAWNNATIKDDTPSGVTNGRGAVTFASAGPNTRTTQIFVNMRNNSFLDNQGFTPFGSIASGIDVLTKLYSGYGDKPTPRQGEMMTQGNAFLEKNYPKLDAIKSAKIISESNPALP